MTVIKVCDCVKVYFKVLIKDKLILQYLCDYNWTLSCACSSTVEYNEKDKLKERTFFTPLREVFLKNFMFMYEMYIHVCLIAYC